jgi:hypothetical protein
MRSKAPTRLIIVTLLIALLTLALSRIFDAPTLAVVAASAVVTALVIGAYSFWHHYRSKDSSYPSLPISADEDATRVVVPQPSISEDEDVPYVVGPPPAITENGDIFINFGEPSVIDDDSPSPFETAPSPAPDERDASSDERDDPVTSIPRPAPSPSPLPSIADPFPAWIEKPAPPQPSSQNTSSYSQNISSYFDETRTVHAATQSSSVIDETIEVAVAILLPESASTLPDDLINFSEVDTQLTLNNDGKTIVEIELLVSSGLAFDERIRTLDVSRETDSQVIFFLGRGVTEGRQVIVVKAHQLVHDSSGIKRQHLADVRLQIAITAKTGTVPDTASMALNFMAVISTEEPIETRRRAHNQAAASSSSLHSRITLREKLVNSCNMDDLHTICFLLNLDRDDYGPRKSAFVIDLIMDLALKQRLHELDDVLQQLQKPR